MGRKRTPAEYEAEIARLTDALTNVHRCSQKQGIALRDAGLDPYPFGRTQEHK